MIDRLSIPDILGLVAPGLIMLAVIRACVGLDVGDLLGPKTARSDLVVTASLLAVAYGLGLVLLELVDVGTRWLQTLGLARAESKANPSAIRPGAFHAVAYALLRLLLGIPLPRVGTSFVEAQLMMYEFNEAQTQKIGLWGISSPWDRIELFRRLVSRLELPGSASVVEALSQVHGRLLYALCLSLSLTLVAARALFDASTAMAQTHQPSKWLAVAILAGLGSWCLRVAAGRCWITEIALACNLVPER
jgi:hypothetical protein